MLREMFSEANGRVSSIRVSMFVVTIAACAVAIYSTMTQKLSIEVIGMVGSMLAVGMGTKVWQKFAESKEQTVEAPPKE